MSRDREIAEGSGRGRSILAAVLLAGLGVGCTQSSEARHGVRPPVQTHPAPPAEESEPHMTRVRVGNYDPRGVDHQPDYDGEAATLRRSMEHRLPSPLPALDIACRGMLDAAERYYRIGESDLALRASLIERFRATRDRDLAGCIRATSAEAAMCTTILLRRQQGEFPWLLDQCSRAYPRPANKDDDPAPSPERGP